MVGEAPDLSCLQTIHGPALVPPAGLQPFASLIEVNVQGAGPRLGLSEGGGFASTYPGSYGLEFDNPDMNGSFNIPEASIEGAPSRQMYANDTAFLLGTYANCAADAAYCANPNPQPGCAGIGCLGPGEIFRHLSARGTDAVVEHIQIGAWNWIVVWFDGNSQMSYHLIDAKDPTLASSDARGLSADNVTAANQVAALADKLIIANGS